jgi:phage RecT family recombinase
MATTSILPKSALPEPMVQTMQALMPHIPDLLPPDISPEQFRAAVYLELTGRQALAECTPESLREAVIKAAMYGLLPGRDCHLLPFTNTRRGGKKDVTYVPNYFGVILALERTGKIRRAFAHPVYEGDEFHCDLFADRPVHRPAVTRGQTPGKELFYYGAIMFKDGTCAFEVVTLEELDAIRRRAPAHESGPWVTDRTMMCRKSCIKRVAKYVRLTAEQAAMLADDDAREREDIPLARQQANIAALYGEGSNPTAPAALRPAATAQNGPEATLTGEVVPPDKPSEPRSGARGPRREPTTAAPDATATPPQGEAPPPPDLSGPDLFAQEEHGNGSPSREG